MHVVLLEQTRGIMHSDLFERPCVHDLEEKNIRMVSQELWRL